MIWAEVLWGLIALVLFLDALRIRKRLAALAVVRPDESEGLPSHRWVLAPGIAIDDQVRQSAEAHVEANGLDALDLIPGSVPLAVAWSYGCHIDPVQHRTQTNRPGDTGAAAFLAPSSAVEPLTSSDVAPDMATFISWAREVRRRVGGSHDLAVVPSLTAQPSNPFFDPGALEVKLGGSAAPVVFGIPFATTLIVLGPFLAPWMGTLAFLVHHVQQWIAVRGTGLQVRLPWFQGLFRIPIDLRQWTQLLVRPTASRERVEQLRPVYSQALEGGYERFFHNPVSSCPMCGSMALTAGFELPDLYQAKPGRFRIVHCKDCGFAFQNPRINEAGLSFYYRDFYDGIGEDALDAVFGATQSLYQDRVALVCAHLTPTNWLDVGCGHGHLFSHVRSVLPSTQLAGLDLGEGVEIALARGWLDEAHRGLFPHMAPELAGRYQVVSMCHYLEHTVDIRAELRAAHLVLESEGCLLIEVPDPESPFARILGRWWMPWFQPQHLAFASTVHMASMLREAGFEPLEWQTGKAHQPNDFTLSFYNMVRSRLPKLDLPWAPPVSSTRRLIQSILWGPGMLFVAMGACLDWMVNPIARRFHHTSQYRVIARKRSVA